MAVEPLSARPEPAQAWQRFLAYVARSRARSAFDEEERDFKPEVAGLVEEMIHRVVTGSDVRAVVEEALAPLDSVFDARLYTLTTPADLRALRAWAAAEPESLGRALTAFRGGGSEPQARFEAFARAAEHAPSAVVDAPDRVLAVGSLLNFALDPERFPIMRRRVLVKLERILGEPVSERSPAEEYAAHLSFVREVERRMREAGVPVRDAIDAQSLIFAAAQEHEFWAVDAPAESTEESRLARAAGKPTYLAACGIYRNEARYLREWVAFHRIVGVERFFLYDNQSTDAHLEALAPYLDDGTVTLHEWPAHPGQLSAFEHALREHGPESRWIAFLDLDEFLFSPTGRPLPEVLRAYERWPAVAVNRANFGTSGHVTPPPGLVVESYEQRIEGGASRYVKSVVDPGEALEARSPHHFSYRFRSAVNESEYPVGGMRTKSVSFSRLRVNHYYTRSEEEFRRKRGRESAVTGSLRPWRDGAVRVATSGVGTLDQEIQIYLPALRSELERVSRR